MIIRAVILAGLIFGLSACGSKEKAPEADNLLLEDDGKDSEDLLTLEDEGGDEERKESQAAEPAVPPDKSVQGYVEELKIIRASDNTSEVTRAAAKVLEGQPKNVEALNALAMHYLKAGRSGMARRILDRAFESHPNDSSLYNNLGLIHWREDRQREAIVAFKKALQLDGENAAAAKNLGSIYANFRDYKRAYPLLLVAYRKFPKNETVANNMAVTLKNLKRPKAAKGIFEKRLAGSDNPSVLYNYAFLLVNDLGNHQKGLEIIEKVRKKKLSARMAARLELLEKTARARLK